jgi:hypothetical protein
MIGDATFAEMRAAIDGAEVFRRGGVPARRTVPARGPFRRDAVVALCGLGFGEAGRASRRTEGAGVEEE